MDEITLTTIDNSINQVNERMDDLHNRIDETNINLRLLITENNSAHKDSNRKIESICRFISKVDKKNSLIEQKVDNHITNEKESKNGINDYIKSLSVAIIGVIGTLLATGNINL